jgi:RES domain-containing protein
MLVYRIILAKYSSKLIASGRAARWNPNEVNIVYTASSRSLACLENAVHRSQAGLSRLFNIMTIEIPDKIETTIIRINHLPADWTDYNQMYITQRLGEKWIKENESAILQVPSSIIEEEFNYLLNQAHSDFRQIELIKTQPFVFDKRIKH